MDFTNRLLEWYRGNMRNLPWRNTPEPYKVWISEIILQQTRMAQGIPYYYRFLERFPDIHSLAEASIDEVLEIWQGLGYYSRARNLHHGARQIVQERLGKWPETYREWLQIKGVGSYTAAAITSMVYGEAIAAVDGNALRVFSRVFGLDANIDSAAGRNEIRQIANDIIDKRNPGAFNQAVMDFGSVICKPARPACAWCPFQMECRALQSGDAQKYPVRKPKKPAKSRHFNYIQLMFHHADESSDGPWFLIRQRRGKDIWQGLYELPMIETATSVEPDVLLDDQALTALIGCNCFQMEKTIRLTHKLTHQTIHAQCIRIRAGKGCKPRTPEGLILVNREAFENKAKPRLMERFMQELDD